MDKTTASGSATGQMALPSTSFAAVGASAAVVAAAAAAAAPASASESIDDAVASTSTGATPTPSSPLPRQPIVSSAVAEAYRAICENDTIASRIVLEIIRIVGLLRGDGSDSRRVKIADDFVDLLNGISTPHEAYMFVKRFATLCRKISQRRRKTVRGSGNFTHFSGKPRRTVQVTKKHAIRPRRNVTWNQPYVIGRLNGHHMM